jgi:hypothetical protein
LQSMIVLLLDTVAKEWNLTKVMTRSEPRKVEKPEPSPSLAKSPFKRTEETL